MAQPTICDDLKRIRAEWRESAVRDFDEARQLELMKLERIEREAWSAWDQSKKPAQSAVVTSEGAAQKTRKSMKNQHGDHRSWTRSTSASPIAGPCWAWMRRWESRREPMSYPWTYDEIASLPSLLRYASGPELKQLERDLNSLA